MAITAYQFGGGVAGLQLLNGVNLSASLTAIADKNNTPSFLKLSTSNISLEAPTFLSLLFQQTLGTRIGFSASQTVNVPSAGNGVFRMISNAYTINNLAAQTGSITGFYLNATETALNGITHNLLDLQVNNVSRFRVPTGNNNVVGYGFTSTTDFLAASAGAFYFTGRTIIQSPTDGNLRISNSSLNGFGLLQLGGTTNTFPAIKRNGAAIDFKLADDSAPCAITAATFTQTAGDFSTIISGTNFSISTNGGTIVYSGVSRFNSNILVGSGSINGSAILQAESTTKGFLMPRMTQAQILLIGTPANGLMVYNTTLNQPCFFDGTIWNKLNHSPM